MTDRSMKEECVIRTYKEWNIKKVKQRGNGMDGKEKSSETARVRGRGRNLKKTDPPGIESWPSTGFLNTSSESLIHWWNWKKGKKKKPTKTTFKAAEKCSQPTHSQQVMISSNCKWIIRLPPGKMLVKNQNKVSKGTPAKWVDLPFQKGWCIGALCRATAEFRCGRELTQSIKHNLITFK